MPPDFVLVVNPAAGRGAATPLAAALKARLEVAGAQASLHFTIDREETATCVRQAADDGVKAIIACGGDGTLQVVANAMGDRDMAMGILPIGNCNDFARAMGLRTGRLLVERTADILLQNRQRRVDVGAIGERRFLTVATLGFDSEVSEIVASHQLLPRRGKLAYVLGAISTLLRFRAPRVRLGGDFGTCDGPIFMAASAITPFYGGGIPVCPAADMSDGLLEVCLIEELSTFQRTRVMLSMLRGQHMDLLGVRFLKTKTLSILGLDAKLALYADGEPVGLAPCTIDVKRSALRVIVP